MLSYDIVKWIHILSAVVFFGTGLGTAAYMWLTHKGGNVQAIASTARNVVRVDWTFTATSGLVQPITGAILVWMLGFSPGAPWLVASYILYAIALGCWVSVARLHMRVREVAAVAAQNGKALPDRYYWYMRWWFQLGWPAFIALLVVFYLMVARPQAAAAGVTGIPAL